MNWLDALGGIGKGVSLGTKDLREMQDENLRREMQKQEMDLRQQTIDENTRRQQMRTDLKGIRKPGSTSYQDDFKETGAGSQQARMLEQQTKDFGQEGADKTKAALGGKGPAKGKKVTEGDRMRDASDVYAEHGELDKSVAASTQARTMDAADRSEATMAKYRQMMPMVEEDPVGFLTQYAPDWYKKMVPDGFTAVTASTPQGVMISLYDDKRNQIVQQRVLPTAQLKVAAKDIAEKMFLYEMGMISPDMFLKSFEMGIKQQQAGAQQTTANAALMNAERQSRVADAEIATGGWGQVGLRQAQGNYYTSRAAQEPKGHAPRWQVIGQTEDGQLIQHDATTNQFQVGGPAGAGGMFPRATGVKPTANIPPAIQQAFAGELRDAGTDPKMADAVMKKWEKLYPGISGRPGGVDPIIEALRRAPPPSKGGKPPPAGSKASKPAIVDPAVATPKGISKSDGLESATPEQLFRAVESTNPLEKKFAIEELRRRGLVGDESSSTVRGSGKLLLDRG